MKERHLPRIVTLTRSLAIWVFANDHAPPHFHVISPETDALVGIRTLKVIVGEYRRQDLEAALERAAEPANRAFLIAEWRRLNERD